MNNKRFTVRALAAAVILALVAGCSTNPYTGEEEMSKKGKGSLIGAGGGAIIGAIAGGRKAALIGAGIGAIAGLGVGHYMDRQEDKLRAQLQGSGVSVTRVGDNINLNMPGNVTFATDSADINADFYDVLTSVVLVLKEYEKTLIQVVGYTDNTGSVEYNQQLSERRAASVTRFLESQDIREVRIETYGFGVDNPIATNDTPEGRQLNRRVELTLVPLT